MSAMQIIYHPGWTGRSWPGLESDRDPAWPAARASAWATWLAIALAVAIAGLMLGQAAAVAVGAPLCAVALPFAVVGLWIALTVFFYEIGGCDHDEIT